MKKIKEERFTLKDLGIKPEDILDAEFIELENGEYDFQIKLSEESQSILLALGERLNINPTELLFQMALSDDKEVIIKDGIIQNHNLKQNRIKNLILSLLSIFLKK